MLKLQFKTKIWKTIYIKFLCIRDITLPTKARLIKAMVFPVVMYGCVSWTVKKAEYQKIDALELWCWRFLSVPWTARRSNQSILKEINPGISLEGMMLKLKQKNWCFWAVVIKKTPESPLNCKEIQQVHPKGNQSWLFIGRSDVEAEIPILWPPDVKNWLIGRDPDAGKDWRWEEKGTTENETVGLHYDSMDMSLSKTVSWWWTGKSGVLHSMGSQRVGHDWATELNWTASTTLTYT